MRRVLLSLVTSALALSCVSCGGPPDPPEGFRLDVHLVSIDTAIIERLRLTFTPRVGDSFEDIDETTYEGGGITVRTDSEGRFVMDITRQHVEANAVPSADGTRMIYSVQIWSDDPAMTTAPLVVGSVTRSGEFIGTGMVYLPGWPPPLEASTQLNIPCTVSPERCRDL